MKKMHLKIRRKKNIIINVFIIICIGLVSSFFIIHFLNKKLTPSLINYAEVIAKNISTSIINKSVIGKSKQDFDINSLIITQTNESGRITSVDFDSYKVNNILFSITTEIHENLKKLEKGQIDFNEFNDLDVSKHNNKDKFVYEIPLFYASNNSLLGNLGPKIPVRLKLLNNIETTFESKITDYGINNSLLELIVNVTVTEQLILPINSKKIVINSSIPVAIKLIEGDVPEYFSGNDDKYNKISIPINK